MAEKEYIERRKTCKDCLHFEVCCAHWAFSSDGTRTADDYKRLMDDKVPCATSFKPAADVVEVRHGRWIWTESGEEDYEQYWVCSCCGEKEYIEYNYCPNCGAKMDGKGEGE